MNVVIHLNKKVKCKIFDDTDNKIVYTVEVSNKQVWSKTTPSRSTQKQLDIFSIEQDTIAQSYI